MDQSPLTGRQENNAGQNHNSGKKINIKGETIVIRLQLLTVFT